MPVHSHRETVLRRRAAAIEKRRMELGVGVAALAAAAEIDLSQMVKVLRGRCGLSIDSLGRVAKVLGTSTDALTGASNRAA